MQTDRTLHYGFLLFDGFSNMVLASAVEPLRAARDIRGGEGFSWTLLTLDGRPAISSSGLAIQPHATLATEQRFDLLFVVCGYGVRRHAPRTVLHRLVHLVYQTEELGGLDMGAWLLAAAGLLDGRRATVHWQELDAFAETFPAVTVVSDRYVIDRRRITAGGATTVMELMLRLIREQGGQALAFDVSNLFVYDAVRHPADSHPDRGARSPSLLARAPQLVRAIAEMRRTVEEPVSLAWIAGVAACSTRTLERLFRRELGVPAGRYYQMIRLKLARSLAEETTLNAAEIAERTGFSSTATLSRAFSRHYGQSLRDLRRWRLAGSPR